jgi:fatty acid desaturase
MTNDSIATKGESQTDTAQWKEIVARYQKPSVPRGVWQIVNTLVPYAALWYLMYLCLPVSYWLVVPLAILAGAFMVRVRSRRIPMRSPRSRETTMRFW